MITNFERYFVELVNEKHALRKKAEEEGRRRGLKKGVKEGLEKGMAEGMEKGMEKGSNSEKVRIAKNLLNMKFNIKDIEKATGLKKEEIIKMSRQKQI